MTMFDLVVLDMAGTTVLDDGLVERAFVVALDGAGVATDPADRETALDYVRSSMGQSKIVVFTELASGDAEVGASMNVAFERAYAELVADGLVSAVPGALDVIKRIRAAGIAVAFTTGFAADTQQGILDALGWADAADLALTPADAGGRGRPHPDLNLTALVRLRTESVDRMVVVGDTASDMISGARAGAGRVVGVLTGAHDETRLLDAGATDILDSVAELPALLGLD